MRRPACAQSQGRAGTKSSGSVVLTACDVIFGIGRIGDVASRADGGADVDTDIGDLRRMAAEWPIDLRRCGACND